MDSLSAMEGRRVYADDMSNTEITPETGAEATETAVTGHTGPEPNANLASLAYWSVLIGYVVPFANLIIPLVLMLTTGKEDDFVRDNAKEALNMFIFSVIMLIIGIILIFVVIGIPMLIALGLYVLICSIIGAVQTMGAKAGDPPYRYPFMFRCIS